MKTLTYLIIAINIAARVIRLLVIIHQQECIYESSSPVALNFWSSLACVRFDWKYELVSVFVTSRNAIVA